MTATITDFPAVVRSHERLERGHESAVIIILPTVKIERFIDDEPEPPPSIRRRRNF